MPDLDAFEAQVNEKIKLLSSKNASVRRKAAAWLGEAGDPTAITALAQTYKNDADPRVRETARYALGMFRKLDQELKGPNSDKVMKLLQDVALKGRMGGRLPISVRALVKVELGLLLSAILIVALGFVLPSVLRPAAGNGSTTNPTAQPVIPSSSVPDTDRTTLLTSLRQTWINIGSDANALQQQFQGAQSGTALNCEATFSNPSPVSISENNRRDFADIAALVDSVNVAQTNLSAVKTHFDQSCGGTAVTAEEAGQQVTAIQAVMQALPDIGKGLVTAESLSTTTEEAPATAAPTATAVPTAQATAEASLTVHLQALQRIIDDMTALRSPNSLLTQYWTEAKGPGTKGCSEPIDASTIPADYALPAEAQTNPNMQLANSLVNTGLAFIRQGRDLFATSCPTPGASADRGLQFAQAASDAFNNATTLIDSLR